MNDGVRASARPADVVLLNTDCVVAAGWLERPARRRRTPTRAIATATALTNHGTILSVPERGRAERASCPGACSVDEAEAAVAAASLRLRPRIPTGDRPLRLRPPLGARPRRRLRRGVLARLRRGGRLLPALPRCAGSSRRRRRRLRLPPRRRLLRPRTPCQERHEQVLARRYPYYHQAVDAAARGEAAPSRARSRSRGRALVPPTVTIDGRCLGHDASPARRCTSSSSCTRAGAPGEVTAARARPRAASASCARGRSAARGRRALVWEDVDEDTPRTTIVHRPYQVFDAARARPPGAARRAAS